jgi:hypothetical protein
MRKRCQGLVAAEASSRYCPANWVAVAPSPTAKATRLMESWRVTTNPWSSRLITLASQLAWGSAPMRMNGAAVGKVSSVPGTAVADSERFQPPRLVDGGYVAVWRHGDVGRPGNRPLDPGRHQAVACTGLREARP